MPALTAQTALMQLLVLHVPGLSARLLRDQMPAAPNLASVGGQGRAATLVTLDGASRAQLEAALITGLLPEYLGEFAGGTGEPRIAPFWLKAAASDPLPCRIETDIELAPAWRRADAEPRLVWKTLRSVSLQGPTRTALREADEQARDLLAAAQAAVVVSAWSFDMRGKQAGQSCHPLDRPVLLARGVDQPKQCLGILEVAGILERALTGEVLHDAR